MSPAIYKRNIYSGPQKHEFNYSARYLLSRIWITSMIYIYLYDLYLLQVSLM